MVTWTHDVFGNAVATASFHAQSAQLVKPPFHHLIERKVTWIKAVLFGSSNSGSTADLKDEAARQFERMTDKTTGRWRRQSRLRVVTQESSSAPFAGTFCDKAR